MFTLTKIYAQANSRNVNIASSGVVSCSRVETYLSSDGLHGYTKTENLSTIIEIE